MPVKLPSQMAQLKRAFKDRKPIRTGSLIVTMFGDSIAPRGGSIWLGSLIGAFEALDIQHRLVRTAVYRLVQDGILTNEAVGRRSYYALTREGKREFDEATQRIYFEPTTDWNGKWCMVIISNLATAERTDLRKRLMWEGFGNFGPDVLAHPNPDRTRLQHLLDRAVVMDAELPPDQRNASLQDMINQAWRLDDLARAYQNYIDLFQPFLDALHNGERLSDEDAFLLRTFMIHEYRKALLRDPALPEALLSPSWTGAAAYRLSQALYPLIVDDAESYVNEKFENRFGALPQPSGSFTERFGGLINTQA